MLKKTLLALPFRHSFWPALSALPATSAANAESVMKVCGEQWKAAKTAGATGGKTWPEFLAQCRTEQKAARAGEWRPPPPSRPRLPLPPRRLQPAAAAQEPQPATAAAPAMPQKKTTKTTAMAARPGTICNRGGSQGQVPDRHGRVGQHQVEDFPLRQPSRLRQDQAGRLYVRDGRDRGGRGGGQEREEAEA